MRLEVLRQLKDDSKPIAVFNDGKRRFIEITDKPKGTSGAEKLAEQDIGQILKSNDTAKIIKLLEDKLVQSRYLDEDEKIFTLTDDDKPKSVMFMPDFSKERELLYVFGPSGSGKSTLAKKYAKEFKLGRPDYTIFLLSKISDDESLDGIEFTHIPLEEDVLRDLEPKSFQDSLVIFDDTDTPSNKAVTKLVDGIKDEIAQEGRHYNVSAIYTTHQALGYNRTRIILNECQKYIIFPQSSGQKQMKSMFTTYGGLENNKFLQIKKEPSRWCMLNINYPNYLVYDNKVELL